MIRTIVFSLLALVLVLSGTAISCAPEAPEVPETAVWKWHTAEASAEDRGIKHFQTVFMDYVEKQSGGQISFDVYYKSALGVKQPDIGKALAEGVLDIGHMDSGSAGWYAPLDVTDLAMLIPFDARVRQNIMDNIGEPVWSKGLEEREVVLLASIIMEPRVAYTKEPVKSLNDLQGMKIRCIPGVEEAFTDALGAAGVAVPYGEVYMAMTTGVIDGYWLTHAATYSSGLYEVADYAWELASGGPTVYIACNKKLFALLPSSLQKIMRDAGRVAEEHWWTVLEGMFGDYRTKLEQEGLTVYPASEADRATARKAAETAVWGTMAELRGAEFQALLAKIR